MKKAGVKSAQEIKIEANKKEYDALNPDVWKKTFFDKTTGGFLATELKRILQAKKSKNEMAKFKKEQSQLMTMAKGGFRAKHIDDSGLIKFDGYVNDISAELKKLSGDGNIINEAKDAVKAKQANLVVFEFEKETKAIYKELLELKKMKINGYYWFKGGESNIYEF
jgi:hypothetical protein